MSDDVEISSLGRFEAQRLEADGRIYCYSQGIRFKGSQPELIVYPNDDGTPLTDRQKDELRERFLRFSSSVDAALNDLPRQLREVCREYRIDVSELGDDELRRGLNWHNIKLEPEGAIECYTDNPSVSKSLDIVLRFSPDLSLAEVYFDG